LADVEDKPIARVEGLASLDEKFKVTGTYFDKYGKRDWSSTLTWREIFAYIAPYLLKYPSDEYVKGILRTALIERESPPGRTHNISDQDFQTVTLQLRALGLINTKYTETVQGGMALFWSLTPQGERLMMQLRTVPPSK
jgi:hypothetical protein